jgi:DNA-binding transcriptional ArsR family regulator
VPRTSAKSQERSSEDAAAFTLAHRFRVEILSALNEAERSESELVRLLHLPQSTVQYHLQELVYAGSVEEVGRRSGRGHKQRLYRGIAIADFLVEQIATWSFEKRQVFWGLVIRNSSAEALAALHAGSISREEKPWLAWARFNFDRRGRDDVYDAFEDFWNRIREIERESDARQEDSGEELDTWVCSLNGFPRSRPGRSSYPKPGA